MTMRRVIICIAVCLITSIAGVLTPRVHAANAINAITVSPLRSEIQIQPSTSYTLALTIKNSGSSAAMVTLDAEKFKVTDEKYDYSFSTTSQINSWVSFSKNSFNLQPGISQLIQATISVPVTAESGGDYISLFATSQPINSASNTISTSERVGSLLYITITGPSTSNGSLVSLTLPFLSLRTPDWNATIHNGGTAHFRSAYSLKLSTLFGQSLGTTQSSSLILPNTIRLVTGSLPTVSWIGIYKADFTIGLGDNPTKHITRYIAIVPPLQAIALLVIIVWTIFIIRTRSRKTRD
jgi:hypothetical protein